MSKEIVSAWAKFFDDNDLQWLVKLDPEKQALIKKAFFAGVEAAQQNMHATPESGGELPAVESNKNTTLPADSA